ncbi:MAG: EAL domain-containing protein [Steroidobacteraceae bacterium]
MNPKAELQPLATVVDAGIAWPATGPRLRTHAHFALRQHLLLTKQLRHAIESSELCLYYQPQYRSSDGSCCGVEALARWFPDGAEPVPPAVFVRHAEQSGLIGALGRWVLQDACSTAATWRPPAGAPLTLSVNVSPHQIEAEFSEFLARTLERTGFPAAQLELEITEGILIEDPEFALECLAGWKQLGVRIAMDDFGCGYSNLSYLSRLPVDRLKIDRSLVCRMVTDRRTAAIVRTVIALGRDLGFAVLAEGVETEAQCEALVRMGCEQMQGFLFAPPLDAREVRLLLEGSAAGLPAATALIPTMGGQLDAC